MKRAINIFTAFIIFTTIVVLLTFCQNLNAQTPNAEKQNKEKLEKLEVQKFVDEFIKNFEETKDLNQVPERFFVADFKARFAKNYSWFSDSSDLFNQLSDLERYNGNVSFVNFSYLGMLCSGGRDVNFAEDLTNTSEDKIDVEKIFPPRIIDLVRKSKTLNAIFIDDSDSDIKNVAELIELFADMKKVADAERVYLNKNKLKWQNIYTKNIKVARKKFEWYKSYVCKGENCENLPEKTRIIQTTVFPFTFSIVKENNELQILDISFLDN